MVESCKLRFAYSGYETLDAHGPWTSDRDSLLRDESFVNFELEWLRELNRLAEQRRAIAKMPKLDKKSLNSLCKAWADTGYNEYVSETEVYYVLFDSRTLDEVGRARDELLKTVEELGLRGR